MKTVEFQLKMSYLLLIESNNNTNMGMKGKLPPFGHFYKLFPQIGLFLKFFMHGSVLDVKGMHAKANRQFHWRFALSVLDSPAPLAISPCMGSCQSNWRVPRRRAQARVLRFHLAGLAGGGLQGLQSGRGTRHSH